MQIIKGKVHEPVKAVVYGPEGIGKTTFASQWPNPLIIDVEKGAAQVGTDRVIPTSYEEVKAIISNLKQDAQGYKTIVFDTADWLEKMISKMVCDREGLSSIESVKFGKAWVMVAEEWKRLCDQLDNLRVSQAVNILFLAHSTIRNFNPPVEEKYDRWEMKLSKQGNSILKEWVSLIFFVNYEVIVTENKAAGGQRYMYSTHSPCWDAKNRYGLKDKLKFDFKEIASIFVDSTPVKTPQQVITSSVEEVKPEPKTEAKPEPKPEPKNEVKEVKPEVKPEVKAETSEDPEKDQALVQLISLCKTAGVTVDELRKEVAAKGIATIDMMPSQYNIATLKKIVANFEIVKRNIIKERSK
jgi:cell division septation protein DedD